MQDVSDLYLLMEETEKQAVRRALLEERGRYCTFIGLLQPVVVRNTGPLVHLRVVGCKRMFYPPPMFPLQNAEIAMLGEITHLQPIVDDLTLLTEDPHKLPPASEQVTEVYYW